MLKKFDGNGRRARFSIPYSTKYPVGVLVNPSEVEAMTDRKV